MSIHHQAMIHLKRAKDLITHGGADELRYAALEMRYCIEHLFYGLLPHYKKELPDDVMSGTIWRPADIIDMIADIDPMVVHDSVLRMGRQAGPGIEPRSMMTVGHQSGLSKDLIRKVYHKLGFYLHARVDRQPHDPAHLRKRLNRLLPYLERYQADTVIFTGAERYEFNCQACGRPVAKRSDHLERDKCITCPNRRCGAIYEYFPDGRHKMLQQKLECEVCGGETWLDLHAQLLRAESGESARCRHCRTEYKVRKYLVAERVADAAPDGCSTGE